MAPPGPRAPRGASCWPAARARCTRPRPGTRRWPRRRGTRPAAPPRQSGRSPAELPWRATTHASLPTAQAPGRASRTGPAGSCRPGGDGSLRLGPSPSPGPPEPMTPTALDPERTPVVVASGQSIERTETVTPIDLMARAGEAAFAHVPGLRDTIGRLSVVNVMTRTGPAPATELAARLGLGGSPACEATTIGGNTPQWLVSRAAD